ncbi:hypothetical protein LOC51_32360 [Rubrivivax sp. JA1024]|nr:hypothetical protein [Rubrivivax sp. JA1024]
MARIIPSMIPATAAALALLATPLAAQPNDAEPATRAANEAITKTLPLADRADKPQREKGGCGHELHARPAAEPLHSCTSHGLLIGAGH